MWVEGTRVGLFVFLKKLTLLPVRKNISLFLYLPPLMIAFVIPRCLFVDFGLFSPKAGFLFSFTNVIQNISVK